MTKIIWHGPVKNGNFDIYLSKHAINSVGVGTAINILFAPTCVAIGLALAPETGGSSAPVAVLCIGIKHVVTEIIVKAGGSVVTCGYKLEYRKFKNVKNVKQ